MTTEPHEATCTPLGQMPGAPGAQTAMCELVPLNAFIDNPQAILRILAHLDLLDDGLERPSQRAPPEPSGNETIVEPFYDDLVSDREGWN